MRLQVSRMSRQSFTAPRHVINATPPSRPFTHTTIRTAAASDPPKRPSPHTSFYKTHGRALFKSLTLAFFSYQTFYWYWLLIESESEKDEKDVRIKALKEEVRLLANGVGSHTLTSGGKRVLEEDEKDG